MFATCRFTVCELRWRRAAISELARPWATRRRTSSSRSLNGSEATCSAGAGADGRIARAAGALDAARGAQLGEGSERCPRLEVGGVVLAERAQHRREIEPRAGGLEGRGARGKERDRLLEIRARGLEVAPCAREMSPRRRGECPHEVGRQRAGEPFQRGSRGSGSLDLAGGAGGSHHQPQTGNVIGAHRLAELAQMALGDPQRRVRSLLLELEHRAAEDRARVRGLLVEDGARLGVSALAQTHLTQRHPHLGRVHAHFPRQIEPDALDLHLGLRPLARPHQKIDVVPATEGEPELLVPLLVRRREPDAAIDRRDRGRARSRRRSARSSRRCRAPRGP